MKILLRFDVPLGYCLFVRAFLLINILVPTCFATEVTRNRIQQCPTSTLIATRKKKDGLKL